MIYFGFGRESWPLSCAAALAPAAGRGPALQQAAALVKLEEPEGAIITSWPSGPSFTIGSREQTLPGIPVCRAQAQCSVSCIGSQSGETRHWSSGGVGWGGGGGEPERAKQILSVETRLHAPILILWNYWTANGVGWLETTIEFFFPQNKNTVKINMCSIFWPTTSSILGKFPYVIILGLM